MSYANLALIKIIKKGYTISDSGILRNPSGKILKGSVNGGYIKICVRLGKRSQNVGVHRMQAYRKYGLQIFKKNIHVRHLNGNPLDNSFENILIGSAYDNHMDIPEHIRVRTAIVASRTRQESIRPIKKRQLIYLDLLNGISFSKIMEKHFVSSKGTLSFMKNKSIEYQQFINAQQII